MDMKPHVSFRAVWFRGIQQWLGQLFIVGTVIALIILIPLLSQKNLDGKDRRTYRAEKNTSKNADPDSPSYQVSDFWLSMSALGRGHGGSD